MANLSSAWLLPIADNRQIAVSEHAIVEYFITPKLLVIPLTPRYCSFVINWRKKFIPVMDIAMLFDLPSLDAVQHIGIIAYQHAPRSPIHYGAITLAEPPSRISVDDRQLCKLPSYIDDTLMPMVLSCFTHNEAKIPILDMAYLFSDTFRNRIMDTR